MASLFTYLRPARLIRRKAMYAGVLGSSRFWKFVAVGLYGRSIVKRFFGRQTEVLDASRFGAGVNYRVVTSKPLTRRQKRRLKRRGELPTKRSEKVAAQAWANDKVAEKLAARDSRTRRLL